MPVVDASIVVRLLQNRGGDDDLRDRFRSERRLHAPTLIDAEVASAVRGLLLTSKKEIRITPGRAWQMLDDFADLPLTRYPMLPLQRWALELRQNLTAYDAFYVALAQLLELPLLTDDGKFVGAPNLPARVETWPPKTADGP